MARRSRDDHPGSWHHVINRGLAKRPLFESRGDARFFLARLARQVRLDRIEVHAYCLMTTHFHLLVRSPVGEMSEAMRRAQNEYSRRFNRRMRRDGSLVRGRFFSKPVLSAEYQRVLVRYIDANPVLAGMVAASHEYELGSAAAYSRGSGPRWMSREWIEAEACRATGAERFTPAVYRAAFGAKDERALAETCELVDARIASTAGADPLDDLIGTAPQDVQAWMRRKAVLADGQQVGLPVCGRLALGRALEGDDRRRGVWMVEDGQQTWRGAELVRVGFLHDLCGRSWSEIAGASDGSVSRARRLGRVHRRLLHSRPAYAQRAAEVARDAISPIR